MKIGTMSSLNPAKIDCLFDKIARLGLHQTQLTCWNRDMYTDENAAKVMEQSRKSDVRVCALWAGYCGPMYWNFTQGPLTLGIVPPETRERRVADLKAGADFAQKIGAPAIITHCGFLPENMTDPNYPVIRDVLADLAYYCKERGLGFWFETGQETPVVLLRFIEDINSGNMGLNLDPANLIMYGKGNPCDALEVFGKYVRNMHVKDGMPPTTGNALGPEVQVGKGFVNFPRLLPRLKELGFDGEFVIEREIQEGPEQTRDIQETIANLKKWWGEE